MKINAGNAGWIALASGIAGAGVCARADWIWSVASKTTASVASNDMGSPEDCLARYRALRVERPDCFRDPASSPIAILTDDDDIAAAQADEAARRKLNKQLAPDVRVGVLAADPYLGMLARDAVRFADQSLGVYNRHIGEPGCVIMPKIA